MTDHPRNTILVGDCLPVMQTLPTGCADTALTSPPYEDARLYRPLEFTASGQDWVDWMIPRVVEACRVTAGLVFINMAGKRRDWKYSPVVEWLVTDLTRHHGLVCGPAPYVFHRIGIPGSGSGKYHRRDWEPVYAFAREEHCPPKWTDNTAMGHPPKWAPGGEMSNRLKDGSRRDQWGSTGHASGMEGRHANGKHKTRLGKMQSQIDRDGAEPKVAAALKGGLPRGAKLHTKNDGDGMRVQLYTEPVLADPGNVIEEHYTAEQVAEIIAAYESGDVVKCLVGGGVMGDSLCHENEAPFPERLCEFFIRSFCPEGGTILDFCGGSGTVAKVAQRWGRGFISIDARESQVELQRKRLAEHGSPLFP